MKVKSKTFRLNVHFARSMWGNLPKIAICSLKTLTGQYGLSVADGDLQFLEGRWYVTHTGLLGIASRRRCQGIKTAVQDRLSEPAVSRWVFKAIVYKSNRSQGFVGFGDADRSNVSPLVHGAEMRVAETRAVNRALRKAYGIGVCSVEELGWVSNRSDPGPAKHQISSPVRNNDHSNGQPRLRDRLCLLIRQHQLDASAVKAYAADYCGSPSLRDASRDQVEAFINHLAERAASDRDALLCHLNSYPKPHEVSK